MIKVVNKKEMKYKFKKRLSRLDLRTYLTKELDGPQYNAHPPIPVNSALIIVIYK